MTSYHFLDGAYVEATRIPLSFGIWIRIQTTVIGARCGYITNEAETIQSIETSLLVP